jgi:hypothetical protein
MSITLSSEVTKRIIEKLLKGKDYRIEIITLINAEFLQYAIEFFKRVVYAKLKNENITVDWYKKEFLNENLPSDEIAINSGLNKKTISNMYNSARKKVVIDAAFEHYETLYNSIQKLIENDNDLNITLTIKLKGVSVDLNISESLIVINTLAVKRAALRGGLWSTAGKRVEKPLMETLCMLFGVDKRNYRLKSKNSDNDLSFEREIDFYLVKDNEEYKCEVKLMGKGNPESADAVIARDSKVFVADKLSQNNKNQLGCLGVEWVELRSTNGYLRFGTVLNNLGIPHKNINSFDDEDLEKIFNHIFTNI